MSQKRKRAKQVPSVVSVESINSASVTIIVLSILIIGALSAAAHSRNSIYQNHVTLWESVVKQSPNKRRAHENLGQALSTAGSVSRDPVEAGKLYNAALQQFQAVLSLKDDGSVPMRDLYREIGVVYFRQGRFGDAIVAWQTGLRYAPNDPSLLNNLSIAYMQTGRFDEAASIASAALSVDPYMPQALNTMGQVAMAKNEYDKAAQFFLKAIEQEPDVPARYWNAAIALEQAKRYDMAFQYAKKYQSMESDPLLQQKANAYLEHLKLVMRR
jgi:tetratricopeptide (TPR) repeat protein